MFDNEKLYGIIEERDNEIRRMYSESRRKIQAIASEMSTEDIIEALIEIGDYDDDDIGNILQDELEGRDKEAFDAWHDEQCPPVWEHLSDYFIA